MSNFKKSKEHLANAALASPIAFLMGGPAGVISALGLGKVLDVLDDIEFEKRQEEGKNNPNRAANLSLEELQEKMKICDDYEERINNLPQIQEGKCIRGTWNRKRGHEKEEYVTTLGGNGLQYSMSGVGKGEVIFHAGAYDFIGYKRIPATLYYNEKDFYEAFMNDYKNHPNMNIYRFISGSYKNGQWMYTINNGKSYVVGL